MAALVIFRFFNFAIFHSGIDVHDYSFLSFFFHFYLWTLMNHILNNIIIKNIPVHTPVNHNAISDIFPEVLTNFLQNPWTLLLLLNSLLDGNVVWPKKVVHQFIEGGKVYRYLAIFCLLQGDSSLVFRSNWLSNYDFICIIKVRIIFKCHKSFLNLVHPAESFTFH